MRIRHAEPEDLDALRRIHAAQGFAYELPPIFADASETDERKRRIARSWIVRVVLEERPNEPQMAVLARQTAEIYLLMDPSQGSVREKIGCLAALDREMAPLAIRAGLTDAHCWLPPEIEKRFGRLMEKRMGWRRPAWTCYAREI